MLRFQAIAVLMESLSYSCICADTDLEKGWIHRSEKRVQQLEQSVSLCKRQSQSEGEHAVQMNILLSRNLENQDFCPAKGGDVARVQAQSHEGNLVTQKKSPVYAWQLPFEQKPFLLRQWYPCSSA